MEPAADPATALGGVLMGAACSLAVSWMAIRRLRKIAAHELQRGLPPGRVPVARRTGTAAVVCFAAAGVLILIKAQANKAQ